jgi:hypothetical protein
VSDEAMELLLSHVHKLSAPGSRITADHMPGGQQHDPASWLLAHGWTAGVSRASSVARAYRRPVTDLQPENLRVMQLITGELD